MMHRWKGRLISACAMLLLWNQPVHATPKIQEITAEGDRKAWLIEDHKLPFVTLRIVFERGGAAYDPQALPGIAYFTASMMNEGAGDMDSLAFNRKLEDHAVRFAAEAGEDTMTVSMQTLSEFKDASFDLLALALNKPRFDATAVERVRAELLTTLRQAQEDPGYLASLNWKERAFAGHPYHRAKIGTQESISAISRDDLRAFQESHLQCGMKDIAIVGDITPAEVKKLLTKLFPARECSAALPTIPNVQIADGDGKPVAVNHDVPQAVIRASVPGIVRNDPRYYAFVVLNNILGGNLMTSRMGKEIRDKRGLAYYAYSETGEFEHGAFMAMNFATRAPEAQTAINVLMTIMQQLQDKGVTQEELDESKRYLTGSFPLGLDSQNSLAEYLDSMQRYHLGIDYLAKRNRLLEAVTLQQVNTLAKELLAHKPLLVMVGPISEGVHK